MHTGPSSVFRVTILVWLALAGVVVYSIKSAESASSTPTYVLGVSDPLDPLIIRLQTLTSSLTILTVSDLTLVSGNSILFIDGGWLESITSLNPAVLSLVVGKVLEGVPIVVVRGNPTLLGDSTSGLIRVRAPDLPLIAEGLKITGALADGTKQAASLQVLAGFDYAVKREFAWAEQRVSGPGALTVPAPSAITRPSRYDSASADSVEQASTGPSWLPLLEATHDTGDHFSPFGRVISTISISRLDPDNSEDFKWFNFFLSQTIYPGVSIYNSQFRNSEQRTFVQASQSNENAIVDHGPTMTSIQGGDVITYEIGVRGDLGATVTATQTQSYFLKHATVSDDSSQDPFGQDPFVSWLHDIDSRSDSGKLSFEIIPGCTLRVTQNRSIDLHGLLTTTFDQIKGNTIEGSQSTTLGFSVFGG